MDDDIVPEPILPNPDPNIGFGPPDGEVGDFFPLITAPAPSDTFEIGLVLGGTVSAAAFTAGALDFLIEALDAWTVAKNASDPGAPKHKVVIKIISGTSGGGVTAALLARILGFAFPPYRPDLPPAQKQKNPLYDSWVNQVGIGELLQLDDLASGEAISSLLCAKKLTEVEQSIPGLGGDPLGTNGTPAQRSYIEQLLPVVLTLTNLRGVPYKSKFRGTERPEFFSDRADHIRFRVDITGVNPPKAADLKPFEVGISQTPAPSVQPWSTIAHAARGTSAFPIGLPPQRITRDIEHYRYRFAVVEPQPGSKQVIWMRPVWQHMIGVGADRTAPYQFECMDGGCINNEPVEFARRELAGVLGHNDREKDKAHRAVLLIDPFADRPDAGPVNDPKIIGDVGDLILTLVANGRFASADLDLFTDDDVYSRFLINPIRPSDPPIGSDPVDPVWTGGDAIAASGLFAFAGFLLKDFREHDFQLGRKNCQSFLKKHFRLDETNSLFNGWTDAQKTHFGDAEGLLPIIPLMGRLDTDDLPLPAWPKDQFDIQSIHDVLKARVKKLGDNATASTIDSKSFLVRLLLRKIIGSLTDTVFDLLQQGILDGLRKSKLLKKQ